LEAGGVWVTAARTTLEKRNCIRAALRIARIAEKALQIDLIGRGRGFSIAVVQVLHGPARSTCGTISAENPMVGM
jgi:hypothetical protein